MKKSGVAGLCMLTAWASWVIGLLWSGYLLLGRLLDNAPHTAKYIVTPVGIGLGLCALLYIVALVFLTKGMRQK